MIKILRCQNKILEKNLSAPKNILNWLIHRDAEINAIKDGIRTQSDNYKSRLEDHPNPFARELPHNAARSRLKK